MRIFNCFKEGVKKAKKQNHKNRMGEICMKDISKRKRLLRNNKGFSMVELLIGLLIIAVIAAASLTLLGGVLNTSKTKADEEAAETIKRAIEGYIHATNDVDLSSIAVVTGNTDTEKLLEVLSGKIVITSTGTTTQKLKADNTWDTANTAASVTSSTLTHDATDLEGTFGPFLDSKKKLYPQAPNMKSWEVHVNIGGGSVLVKASPDAAAGKKITIIS